MMSTNKTKTNGSPTVQVVSGSSTAKSDLSSYPEDGGISAALAATKALRSSLLVQDGGFKLLFQKADQLEAVSVKTHSPMVSDAIKGLLVVVEAMRSSRDNVNKAFNATLRSVQTLHYQPPPPQSDCGLGQTENASAGTQTDVEANSVGTDTPCWWDSVPRQKPVPTRNDKGDAARKRLPRQNSNQPQLSDPTSEEFTVVENKRDRRKRIKRTRLDAPVELTAQPVDHPTKKLRTRQDVVIVKAGDMKYSEMLKKIKTDKEVQSLGDSISAVSETKSGHLRVVLNRKTTNAEELSNAITRAVGSDTICTKLTDTTRIEIRDVDEEATEEEIVQAIAKTIKLTTSATVLQMRNVGRGTKVVTVMVPTSAANSLASARLRVGYVNCRVRLKTEVKKCFKCQGYGHTRAQCTHNDRSNLCWKCGTEGHKARECTLEARCFLCSGEASNDHVLGTFKCHVYRRAYEDATKKSK